MKGKQCCKGRLRPFLYGPRLYGIFSRVYVSVETTHQEASRRSVTCST